MRVDEWGTRRWRNAVEHKKAAFVSYTGGSIHSLNDGGGFNEIILNVWKPIPRETLNTVLYLVTLKILSVLPHARVTTRIIHICIWVGTYTYYIIYILKFVHCVFRRVIYHIFIFFVSHSSKKYHLYIYTEGCIRMPCTPAVSAKRYIHDVYILHITFYTISVVRIGEMVGHVYTHVKCARI